LLCTPFPNVDHEAKRPYYKCLTRLEPRRDRREVKCHQHQQSCKYFCRQLDTQISNCDLCYWTQHEPRTLYKPEPEYKCANCLF